MSEGAKKYRQISGRKRKWIVLAAILFPCFLAAVFSVYYVSYVHYYGSIEVICEQQNDLKGVEVLGLSPLGNTLNTNKSEKLFEYKHERFYRGLDLINPTEKSARFTIITHYQNNDSITLTISPGSSYRYSFENLNKPDFIEKYNMLLKFVSQKLSFKYFLVASLLILLISVVFKFRKALYQCKLFRFSWYSFNVWRITMLSSLFVIITSGIVVLIAGKSHLFSEEYSMDNQVNIVSGPDQLDYQTIAVNFALNNTWRVNGIVDTTTDYRLNLDFPKSPSMQTENRTKLLFNSGMVCYHRFPAYPVLVGSIYKLVGINPVVIKCIQLALLFICMLFIPIFTYKIWGKSGFFAGTLTQIILFYLAAPLATLVSPDLITICLNFFIIWLFYSFRKSKSLGLGIVLGVVTGFSFLIKSSLMFFVALIMIYWLISIIKSNDRDFLKKSVLAFIVFIAVWLPFNLVTISNFKAEKLKSIKLIHDIRTENANTINQRLSRNEYGSTISHWIYPLDQKDIDVYLNSIDNELIEYKSFDASKMHLYPEKSVKLAYLQMQSEHFDWFFLIAQYPINTGMDLHNEYVIDGKQHPEWRSRTDSYYNNDGISNESFPKSAMGFYAHNPTQIFSIAGSKFNSIFSKMFVFRWFSLVLPVFVFLRLVTGRLLRRRLILTMLTLLVFVLLPFLGLTGSIMLSILYCFTIKIFDRDDTILVIPAEFLAVIASMLIFITITYAVERYVLYYVLPFFFISSVCTILILEQLYACVKCVPFAPLRGKCVIDMKSKQKSKS